jgi:hypothetical protein
MMAAMETNNVRMGARIRVSTPRIVWSGVMHISKIVDFSEKLEGMKGPPLASPLSMLGYAGEDRNDEELT